jgi:hypothetical protein
MRVLPQPAYKEMQSPHFRCATVTTTKKPRGALNFISRDSTGASISPGERKTDAARRV